ncbi:Ribosomal RNA small subunit methyltransferase D [Maioricimonas rarisocia]|uniref:Ribosomal RNA small subunit methyltransferase D n=1 Tax=Maioricimonas rarisocia TaxID=2528026 RepID=A0A517ZAE3_9PLAN|nr:16S rRNA (guanine(966)-N(2))-methyltransferase RsmD [Maioricimonas rarisocia]QDU39454.1 Ribosomal RNA small subunit methyltransferase D [Maioricimonas rarisocia]
MRIIAGRFRRRKLDSNPGLTTRPITDRVKESLFQLFGDQVVDRRVADVFAGTGTIGLEALSRGASSVVFIEQDRRALDLLRKNIDRLGVADETMCWSADVFRTSFRPKGVDAFLPYEVIFFDPPYRLVERLKEGMPLYRSLQRLARPQVTSDDALLFFRTPLRSEFDMPEVWQLQQTLDFSNMEIHTYRKVVDAPEESGQDD